MIKPITVELGSTIKRKNSSEYTRVNFIYCREYNLSIAGNGRIVEQMAKLLAENKCDISRPYEVLRGDTRVWSLVPLKWWLNPPDKRPENLRKKDV